MKQKIFSAGHMKEKARVLMTTNLVADPDEVRQAIDSLTDADLVKLRQLSEIAAFRLRRKVWGTDAKDMLQEAILRVLEGTRHWNPKKVDFVGFLAGTMLSIQSSWRKQAKRGELPILEADLPATNSDGKAMPNALQQAADHRLNPEQQLIESAALTQEQLFQQLEELFSEDSLAALIFSERRRGTNGPEIMKAMGLTRQDYDTAVRRMGRAILKRWPEGMPYVR